MLRRALHDMTGMRIHATDGDHYGVETREKELGRVDDLLVAPDEWTIRYIADYLAFLCPGHVSQPPEW